MASSTTLEERVAELERLVDELLQRSTGPEREKDWRSTVGMFANDPVMQEIQEEGRKIREAERRDAES